MNLHPDGPTPFSRSGPADPRLRFRQAWTAAASRAAAPRLEAYLADVPQKERAALLRGLLAIELEHRRRRGEAPTPEEYQGRFPGEVAAVQAAFASADTTPLPLHPPVDVTTPPDAPVRSGPPGDSLPGGRRGSVGRYRIVALGAAGVACLLLAAWVWWPSPPEGPAAVRQGPPAADAPPPSGPARVLHLEVAHYHGDPAELKGFLGADSFATQFNDDVRVHVQLKEPSYAYLIALNPDGRIQLCYPDDPRTTPPRQEEIDYPTRAGRFFGLTDAAGLQAFVTVASSQPLPPYGDWQTRLGTLKWRPIHSPQGVWQFDGRELVPLRHERGQERFGELEPLVATCQAMKGAPGIDAVRAIAFPVLPERVPQPAGEK